jgi:hypothetical protein
MSQRSIFNLPSPISSRGKFVSFVSIPAPGSWGQDTVGMDACTAGLYFPLIPPIPHCLFDVARDRSSTVQLVAVPRSES